MQKRPASQPSADIAEARDSAPGPITGGVWGVWGVHSEGVCTVNIVWNIGKDVPSFSKWPMRPTSDVPTSTPSYTKLQLTCYENFKAR